MLDTVIVTILFVSFTVPGPVQNVELVFSEPANFSRASRMYDLNVNISWEAPSNPNGVILGYNYSLMETSNSSNVIIEYTNTALLSVRQSVMVAPFTNYTATVVALTNAGSGEPVMDVALSPEASKLQWMMVCCVRLGCSYATLCSLSSQCLAQCGMWSWCFWSHLTLTVNLECMSSMSPSPGKLPQSQEETFRHTTTVWWRLIMP